MSLISKLFDVISIENITDPREMVQYLFNVNCNCKKTLKKISQKPDKIIDTPKELIYSFIISQAEKNFFIAEL